jgi:hypothetical protein
MEKSKWYHNFWLKFIIYLPVILILSLILIIYFAYVFTYIHIMMKTDLTLPPSKFILQNTLSPSHAFNKGLILLCFSTFGVIMLLLSYFKVVFSDPGYITSPIQLEYEIIKKNRDIANDPNEHLKYLTKFNDVIAEGPLTNEETDSIRKQMKNFIPAETKGEDFSTLANDQVLEFNKKKLNEENQILETKKSHQEENNNTVFLKLYKGYDLGKANLCSVCMRLKVERSHHCRQCGRCILKMDHHCPWLSNCIGFKNYKAFCLLHFYGFLSTFLIFATYWEVLVNYNLNAELDLFTNCLIMFVYMVNLGLMLFLSWLLYVNIGLLFNGTTIIEQSDRERFPITKSQNIYDMGCYRNFTNVFGTNPLVWFIPFFANLKGDGYVFESHGYRFDSV